MRTTLDIDSDVLNLARSLAEARQTSVGKALSDLARRGVSAQARLSSREGFCVFQVPPGTPQFGPDDVEAAFELEDRIAGRQFAGPVK